ncbi:MAG: flagellar basal body P-ring formation protein FlgA [Rhizobiaceae bacterium]|nr:flagellar basal body P-ring formation protein FlgA [Rhizobiaceae bacterium]
MLARFALPLLAAIVFGAASPALAEGMVVVPKRVIYPNEIITSDLVSEVELRRSRSSVPDVAFAKGEVAGKVARRTLLPGRLIPLGYLRDAYTVEAGKPVTVMLVTGGLEITVKGVPLQPGVVGEVIRVRNADSGATLTGTVMEDGTIRVGES